MLRAVGQTAQLLFRPTLCYAPPYSPATQTKAGKKVIFNPGQPPSTCQSQYLLVTSNVSNSASGVSYNVGADPSLALYPSTSPAQDAKEPQHDRAPARGPRLGKPALPGRPGQADRPHREVRHRPDSLQTGQWVVNVSLTGVGRPRPGTSWPSSTSTRSSPSSSTGSCSRPRSPSRPSRRFTSFNGQVQISGSFTESSAKNLAIALNFGALPVRLDQLTTQTVSPTLGQLLARRRARRGPRRADPRAALHDLLLPAPRDRGGERPGRDRRAAVGDHLRARAHGVGSELRPGRRHRHHRVDRYHRRLLHRLLRTIEGRGARGPDRPHQRRPGIPERVPHRAGRRLRLAARRRCCSTGSPSARCRASRSSSGSRPCSTSSSPTSSPGRSSSCSGAVSG